MPGEAGPCVNLEQQFRDFDVRQQSRRPVNQVLGGRRHRRIQRSHFESGLRDQGVRQIIGESQPVHESQLLLKQSGPFLEICLSIGVHGQRDGARFTQLPESRSRDEIVLKIFELA